MELSKQDVETIEEVMHYLAPRLYSVFKNAMVEALQEHDKMNQEVTGSDFKVDIKKLMKNSTPARANPMDAPAPTPKPPGTSSFRHP